MDKQAVKMKTLGAIFLISLLSFGCGGSGGGTAGDGSPTLGITSVQKTTAKPTLALNLMNKGLGFFVDQPVLAQTAVPCGGEILPFITHEISPFGGKIWITQAYIIIDEIEFNFSTTPLDPTDPLVRIRQTGALAFQLTDNRNDPFNVPESVNLSTIDPGAYELMKVKVDRVDATPSGPTEEDQRPRNLGSEANLNAFLDTIMGPETLSGSRPRAPTIWMEGAILDDFSGLCRRFAYFTDVNNNDKRKVISFKPGVFVDPKEFDVVILLDLIEAFKGLGITAAELSSEIDIDGFLDGTTLTGTPGAKQVANSLLDQLTVFTQDTGTFVKNPGVNLGLNNTTQVSLP